MRQQAQKQQQGSRADGTATTTTGKPAATATTTKEIQLGSVAEELAAAAADQQQDDRRLTVSTATTTTGGPDDEQQPESGGGDAQQADIGGGGTEMSQGATAAGTKDKEAGDEEGSPCECVQCEVCMAENWWRMAALQNQMLQQQQGSGSSGDPNASPTFEISESTATGLDMISSAATLMLSQQQAAAKGGAAGLPAADDVLRADFSMPKLREFFECQRQMGIPNFPEDFDEFWLLVVKARLFNVFKYRGPEAYNRTVLKIREVCQEFRVKLEDRERKEGKNNNNGSSSGNAPTTKVAGGKPAAGKAALKAAGKEAKEKKALAAAQQQQDNNDSDDSIGLPVTPD